MQKKYFYDDGTLRTVESYLDGVLHGEALLYWPNGQLKRKCQFVQGTRHGTDQMWSEEGVLVDEARYERGKWICEETLPPC